MAIKSISDQAINSITCQIEEVRKSTGHFDNWALIRMKRSIGTSCFLNTYMEAELFQSLISAKINYMRLAATSDVNIDHSMFKNAVFYADPAIPDMPIEQAGPIEREVDCLITLIAYVQMINDTCIHIDYENKLIIMNSEQIYKLAQDITAVYQFSGNTIH